ncbi:hypothetical protein GCM10011504_14680 [Siccirubricoccus deserti]|uniref:Uncharacterized protein n=1 Tax=Siccirubricoccus deserti TaxID=2013562 RepID=A0A9X0QWK3_9PROT|nr:hypothetical protein [Siccirubricoccus deserti]MBC4014880.1 hypothetical protein [Siccirubricoccus deserti]GGC37358.1 hypothetical protein GCM10011504_14680 [Siccirubricoccus deserti]
MSPARRLALAAGALLVAAAAMAQDLPPPTAATASAFIDIVPTEGRVPVRLAVAHVVRIGRVEGHTVIDTTAWVQQRTVEPVESVARRLTAAGQRLIALTDLNGARIYLATNRVVLVRDSQERHAAGARAAIVMVGLRFNTDIAVRESPDEVMAALRQAAGPLEIPAAGQPAR